MGKPRKHRPNSRVLQQPSPVLPPDTRAVRPLTYIAHGGGFRFLLSAGLSQARQKGRVSETVQAKIGERILWLDTKRHVLRVAYERVRERWLPLRERAQLAQQGDWREDLYTFPLQAADLLLVADVAAYVIVLHGTLETSVELALSVEKAVLPPTKRTPKEKLRMIPGVSAEEQELLVRARGAFAHAAAPWLSVVLKRDPLGEPDLAILASHDQDYHAGRGYILLSQVFGYAAALNEHIEQLEQRLARCLYAAAGVSPASSPGGGEGASAPGHGTA